MPSPGGRTSEFASSPPTRRPYTRSRTTRTPRCAWPSGAPSPRSARTAKARCCAADKLCMGATATPFDAAATLAPDGAFLEARQTGGVTTRLILDYVEREGGREAVERLVQQTGLQSGDPALRDEHNGSSSATRTPLRKAAAEVPDAPPAPRHIGE